LNADAALRRAYLFADPVAHTRSPAMHNAAFAACGYPGIYLARQVRPAELPHALETLREAGVLGANLSIPHKEAAALLLDSLSSAARRIGAVNTVINQDGHLYGDNTDAPGLLQALADLGYGERGTRPAAVVLGAGGAARAAVDALGVTLGRAVYVVNRTRARAQALAASWAATGAQIIAADLSDVPWAEVGLIVNASSAGLGDPSASPLPAFEFGQLPRGTLVYDMVYVPSTTHLMTQARQAGLQAENGLGMLAHQARLAFVAWTGAAPPPGVFLEALEQRV
jgi:shikimate dehydrogenase